MTSGVPNVRVAYIAGSSFSGSTLLGLILGGAQEVFYCGEINQYRRAAWRSRPVACTCGSEYGECPVWSRVYADLPHGRDLNPSPGFSRANLRLLLSILLPGRRRSSPRKTTEYGAVVEAIRRHAAPVTDEPLWIVDSSKTLEALDALRRSANVDLRVIHLVRDGRGVAASCRKRGRSPLAAMAAWTLVNTALLLYTRRNDIPCLRVDYRSFCENGDAAVAEIRRFLDLEGAAGDVLPPVRRGSYHLMQGNREVRKLASGESEFEGLRYRGDATGLSRPQRVVAGLVIGPLYRFLLSRGELAGQKVPVR